MASSPPFEANALTIALLPFATGLSAPVFATGSRDGSGGLLVVEQAGTIRKVDRDGTVQQTPFLDLSSRVLAGGERGLLGLALGPNYENDGRLYVDYTRRPDGATLISEFQANDRFADPASERVLLTIPQPYANHNGGMLAFDSWGMLFVGVGDGGGAGDPQGYGQNAGALLGKLLRIDVNGNPYAIPADNPFAASAHVAPEVWALGLRNPWRFSFDRLTGDLFMGDAGQSAWEEVDAEPAGQGGRNYGWNVMEGAHCFQPPSGCNRLGLRQPVTEYSHESGCTVVGGYVYRGAAFALLRGGYLFGDFCSGTLWALSASEAIVGGTAKAAVVAPTSVRLSSFGEDDAGELYALDLRSGRVLKVSAAPR